MSRFVLVTLSLSLALAALLVTFTPFIRDFTGFHIGAEVLVPGAFTCGVLCGFSIIPPRLALISLALVLAGVGAVGPLALKGIPEPVDAVEVLWEPASVAGAVPMPGRLVGAASDALFRRSRFSKK